MLIGLLGVGVMGGVMAAYRSGWVERVSDYVSTNIRIGGPQAPTQAPTQPPASTGLQFDDVRHSLIYALLLPAAAAFLMANLFLFALAVRGSKAAAAWIRREAGITRVLFQVFGAVAIQGATNLTWGLVQFLAIATMMGMVGYEMYRFYSKNPNHVHMFLLLLTLMFLVGGLMVMFLWFAFTQIHAQAATLVNMVMVVCATFAMFLGGVKLDWAYTLSVLGLLGLAAMFVVAKSDFRAVSVILVLAAILLGIQFISDILANAEWETQKLDRQRDLAGQSVWNYLYDLLTTDGPPKA